MDDGYSTTINGYTARNPVKVSGSYIFIELFGQPAYATASLTDLEQLAGYRLRFANGKVVTTTATDGVELPITAANLLADLPRSHVLTYRDDNPLNITRENISSPTFSGSLHCQTPNKATGDRHTSFLHLAGGVSIKIDKSRLKDVSRFRWYAINANHHERPLEVRAHYIDAVTNKRHTHLLHRFVLGMELKGKGSVVFVNGNRTDCRLSNLRVIDTETKTPKRRQASLFISSASL